MALLHHTKKYLDDWEGSTRGVSNSPSRLVGWSLICKQQICNNWHTRSLHVAALRRVTSEWLLDLTGEMGVYALFCMIRVVKRRFCFYRDAPFSSIPLFDVCQSAAYVGPSGSGCQYSAIFIVVAVLYSFENLTWPIAWGKRFYKCPK